MVGLVPIVLRLCSITVLLSVVISAPPGEITESHEEIYDQRQNGSENLRIQMDDVMFVVAPAEALLSVAGASELLQLGAAASAIEKPDKTGHECGDKVRCKSDSKR